MKFAEKIIWSCLLTLAILFSIGSSALIYQNHHNLLQTTINHNLSTHEIEVYSLETRLFQDSLEYARDSHQEQSKMIDRAIYYLEQFRYTSQVQKTYALSLSNQEILYSNIDNEYRQYISLDFEQKYFLKHLNQQYKMFVTSKVNAGKNVYYLTSCYDVTSVYQDRDRQIGNFLVISVILFGIAYAILKFLSSYLTQSIHRLNAVSQRIADGEYSERTQIESEDEIGELSRSFDEMAEMNERKIHQLQDSVIQKEEFMGSFSHEVKTPMTAILGFADLLFTLLRNLIDNAMKASQEGQTIIVKTYLENNQVVVSVVDEGMGMSQEDVKKATEAFYMADKSRSRSLGGAGLGLTIVKRICDAHQTELSIQSELHLGTTVSFTLEVIDHE